MNMFNRLFALIGLVLLMGCIGEPKITEVGSSTRLYDLGELGSKEGSLTNYEIEGVDAYYYVVRIPFSSNEFDTYLLKIESDTMFTAIPTTIGEETVYFGFSTPTDETPHMIFWHEGNKMLSISTDASVKDLDVMLDLYDYYLNNR